MAKDKKAASAEAGGTGGVRLSAHPRARRDIAMAKAAGGLGTFAIVALLAQRAGMPFAAVVFRALLAGMAGFVMAWMLAVVVWRHLALAQIEKLRRDIVAEQAARMAGHDPGARSGDAPGAAPSTP